MMSSDLAGVQLLLNAAGDAAEVRQWTGEHETIPGGTSADPVRFRLTVNEQRAVGENDFIGPTANNWSEFSQDPDGRLGVGYTTGTPPFAGSAFNAAAGYELGWLIEGGSGSQQSISFLHELPTAASIADLSGSWNYSAIVIPTSGSAQGSTIDGAYGTVSFADLAGNFTYGANQIGGQTNGSGSIQSLAPFGLGQIADSEYFAVSRDGDVMTAADLSYGDGLTYMSVAVRRGTTVTRDEVAGEYRFGAAVAGDAADRRGAGLLAFESVYLRMEVNGTLTAFDLADWDNGTETVVHTGQWSILPEGRTVLITYADLGETHLVIFGSNHGSFIDLRVSHENGDSYAIGQGQRVVEDNGDGGGGGDQDDHADDGDHANATPIILTGAGTGSGSGTIGVATDTDLFTVTTPIAGTMSVVLDTSLGSLSGSLTLQDSTGAVLATSSATGGQISVSIVWEVTAQTEYFIVVGSGDQASTGAYTLAVTTADDSGGGDDDFVDDFGADDDGSGDQLLDSGDVPFPRLLVSGRAPTGRQAVWERGQDHKWYYSKLGLRSETPGLIGELVTWQDEKTHAFMAAASTETGMILWVRDAASGAYTKRDLTVEAREDDGESEIPASPVNYFRLDDGRNVLTALNAAGDVIAYVESLGSTFMINLSQTEIRDKDRVIPALTGTLTGGVSPWGTSIIAGLDAEGKVWTVWFSIQDSGAGWRATPLSAIAEADPMEGNLSIYFTSWNGINIAGLTETGETTVVWWVPKFGGNWEVSNLTEKFDGPAFQANSMTTYATPWDALTIVGITTDTRLVAYWWVPGFSAWAIADFSALLPKQQPRVVHGPISAAIRGESEIWLFGRDDNGEMIRVAWTRSTDKWASSSMVTDAQQF
jgi:hypothetical protein